MSKWLAALLSIILILTPVPSFGQAQILAFPGAMGYGRYAKCGRGGDVYHVTNLNNSGTGSLRDATNTDGVTPRTIVFDVSGTITLTTGIFMNDPYITIAGQTAPAPGIQLRMDPTYSGTGSPLTIRNHDICVRYLRIRPGAGAPAPGGGQADAIAIAATLTQEPKNIIIDHVSLEWAVDKGIDVGCDYEDPDALCPNQITVQHSIIAQSLHCATHDEGCHSKGATFGGRTYDLSVIANLWAASHERQPLMHNRGRADVISNYTYNANVDGSGPPSQIKLVRDRLMDGDTQKFNIINNVIAYTTTASFDIPGIMFLDRDIPAPATDTQVYLSGNIGISRTTQLQAENLEYGYVDGSSDPWVLVNQTEFLVDKPHSGPWRAAWAAEDVLDNLVVHAGANKSLTCSGTFTDTRDIIDMQVISGVIASTLTLIDDPSEVGGWPDLSGGTPCTDTDADGMPDIWETANSLNPNDAADRNDDGDMDGYTNLEEYLNGTTP